MRQGGLVGNLPEVIRFISHSILGHPVEDIVKYQRFVGSCYICESCGAFDVAPPASVSRETKEER